MESLVLLNSDGSFYKKLNFTEPSPGYEVPEGKLLSWRWLIEKWSRLIREDYFPAWREPLRAVFVLGNAKATIKVDRIQAPRNKADEGKYNLRLITVTVQGSNASDLIALRNEIIVRIETNQRWEAVNNLNPPKKPERVGILERIRILFTGKLAS